MKLQLETVIVNGCSMQYRTDSHDRSILAEIWEEGGYSKKFPFGKRAVILDIGAHNGYFSLFAACNTIEGTSIYAFEPVPDNFNLLKDNIRINNIRNVSAYNVCVAGFDGAQTLYVNTAHTGGHSQYRERVEKYNPESIEAIECVCVAFDHTVPPGTEVIDFCKIDCEGAEFDILLNAPEEFLCRIRVFFIEFHEFGGHKIDELVALFTRLGYMVDYVFSPSRLGISFGNLIAIKG